MLSVGNIIRKKTSKITGYILPVFFLLLLSCSPLKLYQDLPEVKAWEPEIEKLITSGNTEQYSRDAVIFAGSSSIRLWKTLAEDMKPYNVIQRGYGGAKLSDFAVYAEEIFTPLPGRALVLFIANDITGSDKDKSPEEVNKLFLNVVKTFRKSHPGAPVFWIQVTPTSSRWKVWPEIREANELIRQTCERGNNLYFIRTDYAFLNEQELPKDELFVADKLHLNTDGYRLWTGIIKNELDKALINKR
ncbi:MAG TPA: GDSL-type esterase/lipase family protein [Bacteroidales bacterium]|mgnify:FL=1|nr:GDSL-type esterase/lipase family protein [Bacteroidales bacterium]